MARIKLGELLVRVGVIDELKLKAALAEQQRWGGRLGKILVEMNFVSEDVLVKALSKQLGVPRATFDNFNVPEDVLDKLDPGFARGNGICPAGYDANRRILYLAMVDPTNVSALDEVRFKTGLRPEPRLAGEREVNRAIDEFLSKTTTLGAIELATGGETPFVDTGELSNLVTSGRLAGPFGQPPPPSPSTVPQRTTLSTDLPRVRPSSDTTNPTPNSARDLVQKLDAAQKQQVKAMRVMLDLLIEKGVFSRDEYLDLIGRR